MFTWKYDLMYGWYPLVVQFDGDPPATEWLQAPQTSTPVALASRAPDLGSVARQYLWLGFTHILPGGLDHVLFVAGIFFLGAGLRSILVQVTTFTIAHSITLALTLYGWIAAPSSIVEPLIAVSIVYVAIENIVTRRLRPSRVALVFMFGLLHGMGFAGVLRELGLPREAFSTRSSLQRRGGGRSVGRHRAAVRHDRALVRARRVVSPPDRRSRVARHRARRGGLDCAARVVVKSSGEAKASHHVRRTARLKPRTTYDGRRG
jgi:hypothetical protein